MDKFFEDIKTCFKKYTTYDTIISHKQHNKSIKIDIKYLILYKFFNAFFSKEKSTELINKYVCYSRTSLYRQEEQLDLQYYENFNKEISTICNKHISIQNKNKNKYSILSIDGTYSTGENYKNCLNMGYFDATNNIPIEIDMIGINGKNKELHEVMEKIKNDINLFKNRIIVVDRLYFSYKFIHFLISNNIKFIIRCKGDCKNLKLETVTKDKHLIKLIKKRTRIFTFNEIDDKTLTISNKSKKDKSTTMFDIEMQNNCTLITSLSKHFNKKTILEFYKMRWSIETYFKLVKHNFNFEHLTHKKEIEIRKQFLCINIICSIVKVFDLCLSKKKKDENKDILNEFIIKCNETKLMRFFQNIFLDDLIVNNKSSTYKKLIENIKIYTNVRKYKKDRSYPRKCNTPFMKWYIKAYSNQSEIIKILNAINDGTIDKLNNNLKSKSKKIKILGKIKYNF